MSNNSYRFDNNDKDAEAAEKKVAEYFAKWYNVTSVRDVTEYQEMDIDLILTDKKTGEQTTLEVKSDKTYQYGNFAMEHVSNDLKGTEGCFLKTEADVIAIYYPLVNKLYLLDGPKTVKWFRENQHRFPEKKNGTKKMYGTGELYHSYFRLVNRQLFARETDAVIAIIDLDDLAQAS